MNTFLKTALKRITIYCLTGILSLFSLHAGAKISTQQVSALNANLNWQNSQQSLAQIPRGEYPHQSCFVAAATKQKLPLALLLAVAKGESNFNPKAKSHANAYGVMQILWPGTAKDLGITQLQDLFKPCINIHAGARYLRYLLDRYDNNIHLALAAYNYGPGRIKKSMASQGMPKGAVWYSQYIYDHFVEMSKGTQQVLPYRPENEIILVTFEQAYRARGFKQYLQQQHADLDLNWFKTLNGHFQVSLHYKNQQELKQSVQRLKKSGFALQL